MMHLYSGTVCPFSHRCWIVLFEKGMDFEIHDIDLMIKPEDLAVMNPHNRVPVLVERDLILYEPNIINEYIDERFPHPQLMPPDPIQRNMKTADKARSEIRDRLIEIAPIFNKQKHLLGDEFSMLDVAIAPLLWRLDHYEISLPKTAAPLFKYAERIFSRQGFIDSMTPQEKIMRK